MRPLEQRTASRPGDRGFQAIEPTWNPGRFTTIRDSIPDRSKRPSIKRVPRA